MDWLRLLSDKQLGNVRSEVEEAKEGRSAFQRDCDRLIYSTSFRRLQNKTQVIPLPGDHTHNRLTHSLETCSVGRSLGMLTGREIIKLHDEEFEKYAQANSKPKITEDDISYIVAAACLAHDIGNPPLGHSGEEAISAYFNRANPDLFDSLSKEQKADLEHFEGNALGLRILTHSFPSESDFTGGMGLTYATLASFVKYPKESLPLKKSTRKASEKKYGFLQTEKSLFKDIAEHVGLKAKHDKNNLCWCRHPLAFLVEAADDICNRIMDFEDGYKLGLIRFRDVEDTLKDLIGDSLIKSEYSKIHDDSRKIKYLRARAINRLIIQVKEFFVSREKDILEGKFDSNIIGLFPSTKILQKIHRLEKKRFYTERSVLETEAAGFTIIPGLLEAFINATVLDPKAIQSTKISGLIPSQYLNKRRKLFIDKYENIINVVQFVASMTDNFAIDTYRSIKGISLPSY